jgi:hypothetical protein
MAIEYPEPSPGSPREISHEDAILQAEANVAIQQWLEDHPGVANGITETVRAHIHLEELTGRTREAEHAQRDAEQHDAVLLTRHDPAGHRILGFTTGTALVILLVVLDAVPLNWAAQAFGLDSGGTWLVTLILVIASIGAMLGFELTSRHPRRRALLAAVVGAAYLALLVLRTQFLTTVADESLPVALMQSAMQTAISAGLVLCGSAVLTRTRSLSSSRSRAVARRARHAAAEARVGQRAAADNLKRHIGGLRQMLLPWALGSAAPVGVDRARWVAALEQAVRQLFPAS